MSRIAYRRYSCSMAGHLRVQHRHRRKDSVHCTCGTQSILEYYPLRLFRLLYNTSMSVNSVQKHYMQYRQCTTKEYARAQCSLGTCVQDSGAGATEQTLHAHDCTHLELRLLLPVAVLLPPVALGLLRLLRLLRRYRQLLCGSKRSSKIGERMLHCVQIHSTTNTIGTHPIGHMDT
jgi:hypothetical protein